MTPDFVSALAALNRGQRSARRVELRNESAFGRSLRLGSFALRNGLRIHLLPDPDSSIVNYQTWFRVGSRDEDPGRTGLAHMFEHLMFFGTKRHPTGDFDSLLEAAGAENNAATWADWTHYYESLPPEALPLAIELESDRMANLELRADEWARERSVVRNERRQCVDDDVYGAASEVLWHSAYDGHPYSWPTIGWGADIDAYTKRACEQFYRRWYAPNHATLVVVGNFDAGDTLRRIRDAYAGLPPSAHRRRPLVAPPPARARRRTLRLPTPTAKLLIGFRAPGLGDPTSPALGAIRELLTGGLSGRLTRRLLRERELATSVHASVAPFYGPTLFEIYVDARMGVELSEIETEIDDVVGSLLQADVPDAELEKVRAQLELSALSPMDTAAGKAEQIGFYDALFDDPSRFFSRVEAYRSLTPESIRHAARMVFKKNRRTLVRVLPQAERPS